MEIALHLGVHCTDEDRLLKCLRKNADALALAGIGVPQIGRYRPVIREMLLALKDQVPSAETQQTMLDAIIDEDHITRIVLSHDSLLGVPGRAVEKNQLYTTVAQRAPRLRALFASSDVHFHLSIRDPASFIPAVFARAQQTNFSTFMEGSDAATLRWSDVIARLRNAVPGCPVTVWCNEDTPMIWYELLQQLSGHEDGMVLEGRDDFFYELMSPAGGRRLRAYLEANPPKDAAQRRKVVDAFLDKFTDTASLEEEVDLPGWNDAYLTHLSELYEADLEVIDSMHGVTFIEP